MLSRIAFILGLLPGCLWANEAAIRKALEPKLGGARIDLLELRSGRDLTEERLRKLSAIDFKSLPLEQAVKIQRGSGRRILAIFSDAYCPACKKFEGELQQVDDITIYIFIYPVIRPELAEHSKAVWCAPDRGAAWLDLVLRGRRPAAKAGCQDPVEKNLQLGRRLNVNATPTLIFANGERVSGGLPIPQLEERINQRN